MKRERPVAVIRRQSSNDGCVRRADLDLERSEYPHPALLNKTMGCLRKLMLLEVDKYKVALRCEPNAESRLVFNSLKYVRCNRYTKF